MERKLLAKRIIRTFPDTIEYDEYGELDFNSTIYNLADKIVDEFDDNYQKSLFGKVFISSEECEDFLRNKLTMLYDNCKTVAEESKEREKII